MREPGRNSSSAASPTRAGTRTGFGALLLGYYDPARQLIYAGKVGTGFAGERWTACTRHWPGLEQDRPPFDHGTLPRSGVHWVRPRLVAEVGFSEWTTGGELRHPRFQGLRDDKDPADVVRETPQDTTRNDPTAHADPYDPLTIILFGRAFRGRRG